MKIIIAGSRTFEIKKHPEVEKRIDTLLCNQYQPTIVSGTAKGADQYGERYAADRGYAVDRIPAKWDEYGKRAGFVRNHTMAAHADGAIVIWDGASKGSKHMIEIMKSLGKPVRIIRF